MLRQWLLVLVPIAAVLVLGAWWLGQSSYQAALEPLLTQERQFVALASQRLGDELDTPLQHIASLTREAPVRQVYQGGAQTDPRPMEAAFGTLMARNPHYSTVRWIDQSGMERVRIDWDPQRGEPKRRTDLSSKADRYFFREALQTPLHLTYVSPLDLLVDHGRLVEPPFPTLRVARRVLGPNGEARGFLMINLAASHSLATLVKSAAPIAAHLSVLNAQGHWLRSPVAAEEWSHWLGRPGSFAGREPAIWAQVQARASGQAVVEQRVWTWSTVDLGSIHPGEVWTQERWKILNQLPPDEIASVHQRTWRPIGLGTTLLLLLFGVGTYQLARLNVLRHTARQARLRAEEASRSAQAIAQAQQNFRTVFNANTSGLLVVDTAGRVTMVNPEFEHMFGYGPGELNGQPLQVLLPPDLHTPHHQWLQGYFQQPAQRKMGQGRRLAGRRKDGRTVMVEIGLSHFRDGEQGYALANVTDVSARVRAELVDQHRNAVLQMLVEGAALDQILQAIVLGIEEISPGALCSILILDPASGVLRLGAAPSLPDFYNRAITPLPIGEGVGSCGAAAFGGERVIAEDIQTHPNWVPFRALAAQAGLQACWSQPMKDSTQAVLGTFAIYHRHTGGPSADDIALIVQATNLAALAVERRRHEEALAQYRDHLEERVEERAREVRALNLLLEQRVHEVEDASRAKSDFLATMSHEIRTPMNAILGMTHLALKTELTPTQRDHLQKVLRSGRLLLNIINDVLDLSKIEAGKLAIVPNEFDLEGLLGTVTSQLVEAAGRKRLELLLDIAPDVPRRWFGDELRLGQVLLNLGSNAIKFTEHGEVTIRVRVAQRHGDEVSLRFEVQDTGIGLSEAQRQRLFQHFVQADNSITRRYGGTGLGLVISKRLVELMGGGIGVDSRPDQGSTFWFTVAMRALAADARPVHRVPDVRGKSVLVIDDNRPAAQLMQTLLHSMSFAVAVAHSGTEGLAALRQAAARGQAHDAVLLDWHMPDLGGEEVARRLPSLGLSRPPACVVVTGLDAPDVEARALALGAVKVLHKPVTPSVLFDALLEVLHGHRSGQALVGDAEPDLSGIAGARVLLVEDNELNQEVALAFLAEARLRVDLAHHGQEALERVRQVPYDLVLMDMQMPVMDGLTATRAMRQQPELARLPIVAMTANAMAGDRERCLAAGMNDHIAKPIDPHRLRTKLLQWIPPDPGRAADTSGPDTPATPTTTTEMGTLDGIEGLDVGLGLRRVGMRETLYRQLLLRFVQGQADAVQRVEQALALGDAAGAETAAHTLKGVAAQVGAERLSHAAEALELAIRHNPHGPEVRAHLQGVASWLTPLLHTLQQRLASSPPPAEGPVDLDRWPRVRDELVALLQDDNATSELVFLDNEALIQSALGERYPGLARAIRDFDFSAALSHLTEAV